MKLTRDILADIFGRAALLGQDLGMCNSVAGAWRALLLSSSYNPSTRSVHRRVLRIMFRHLGEPYDRNAYAENLPDPESPEGQLARVEFLSKLRRFYGIRRSL